MFKFYTIYLLLGGYVCLRSLETWVFKSWNDCYDSVTWMAMISSAVLFFIVGPLLLYNSKLALKTALICLAGIMPFAVYWLGYIYRFEGFNRNAENRGILLAACVYAIAVFITIRNVRNPSPNYQLHKPIKIALTLMPAVVLVVFLIWNQS